MDSRCFVPQADDAIAPENSATQEPHWLFIAEGASCRFLEDPSCRFRS